MEPCLVSTRSPLQAIRHFGELLFGVAAAIAAGTFLGYRLGHLPAALGLDLAGSLVIGFIVLAAGLALAGDVDHTLSRSRRSAEAPNSDSADSQTPVDVDNAVGVATACGLLEWRTRIESSLAQFRSAIQPAIGLLSSSAQRFTLDTEDLSSSTAATVRRASYAIAEARQLLLGSRDLPADSQTLFASIRDIETKFLSNCGAFSNAAQTMDETAQTIDGVASIATQVAEIAGLIQSVSARTSLLALNATIEAARAGDSGKGFAVIAQEVKMLANQASRAAQSIAEHVAAIQVSAATSVETIASIGAAMHQTDVLAESITAAMHRHAVVAAKVAQDSSRSAANAEGVTQVIEDLNAIVDVNSAAATQLRSVVTDAAAQAKSLRETIDRFLIDVSSQLRSDVVA